MIAGIAALPSLVPAAAQSAVGGDHQFHLIAANSNNSTLIAPGEHAVHAVHMTAEIQPERFA